jgi:hypothetical protein
MRTIKPSNSRNEQPTAKIFAEYTAPALKLAQNNTLLVKETSGRRDASTGAGYKNGQVAAEQLHAILA